MKLSEEAIKIMVAGPELSLSEITSELVKRANDEGLDPKRLNMLKSIDEDLRRIGK